MMMVLKRVLAPFADPTYAMLRIVAGLMFSFHGMQKVFGLLSEQEPVGSQKWFGGLIELLAGLAIAIGFYTRGAAFLASGTMAVAYIQFHWLVKGGASIFPTVNQGELALLYAWLFLYIACRGAGAWSVDDRRARAAVKV